MKIFFNIEPQAKQRPRHTRSGHTYTPSKTRNFESTLKLMAKNVVKEPFDAPLRVSIIFYITRPKSVKRAYPSVKPDCDNLIKAVCDAMNNIIWKDDSLICEISAKKVYSEKGGIHLEVNPL